MQKLEKFMMPLMAENETGEFTISSQSGSDSNSGGGGEFRPPLLQDPRPTYSYGEITNPDSIIVSIDDKTHPVVILFGPKGSGKTMTLIRLTRYLEKNGYKVEPYRLFRPKHDEQHEYICDNFKTVSHSNYAPGGNEAISFMLLKVIDKNGNTICQILEAPGEHYFDAKYPEKQFPTYIKQIVTGLPNKRIWAFIVQKDWHPDTEEAGEIKVDSHQAHVNYSQRVQMIQRTRRDKAIFICHKADQSPNAIINGKPKKQVFKEAVKQQYEGIFNNWMNRIPILKFFKPEFFSFVPFSAGAFSSDGHGRTYYIEGDDIYPKMLWKAIRKTIKG